MVSTTRILDSTAQSRIVFPLLGLLVLLVCAIAAPLSAHAASEITYIAYEVTATVDTLDGADATTQAALLAEGIQVGSTLTVTSMIREDEVGVEAQCAGPSGENLVYAADDPSRGTEISVGNLVLSNMQDANAVGVADDIDVDLGPLGVWPADIFGIAGDTADTSIARFPLDSTQTDPTPGDPCSGDETSKGSAMIAVQVNLTGEGPIDNTDLPTPETLWSPSVFNSPIIEGDTTPGPRVVMDMFDLGNGGASFRIISTVTSWSATRTTVPTTPALPPLGLAAVVAGLLGAGGLVLRARTLRASSN
jgi:hypothetical protein